jgi:multidrug resistance efflux pump
LLLVGAVTGISLWQKRQATQQEHAAAQSTVKTVKVALSRIEQKVRITGPTSSREFANVTAPIMRGPESGREMILLYLVPSGTRVKKGDRLAQIDAKTLEDHIDDIGDSIQAAEADIRKRGAEHSIDMENLNQSIRIAKAELDKARWEAKATEVRTTVEQELLKLAEEEAEARYKQVQQDVRHKEIIQKAEIRILEITKERHARHQGRHKTDLVKFTMFSPMAGLAVVQMAWRGTEYSTIQQGDQVTPGQSFVKVVNPDRMQVEGNINQAESSLFRIGQKATVHLDAFPGLALPGHVQSIGALAAGGFRQQYYIRSVPVKIAVDKADAKLIPDLSAGVDVEIRASDNAKSVPLAAVFTEDDRHFVYVKQADQWAKRAVEIGLRSNTHASVLSGLNVGEEVALERPAIKNEQLTAFAGQRTAGSSAHTADR